MNNVLVGKVVVYLLFNLLILGSLGGCGGGGGYKVDKRILINKIGINKRTINLTNRTVRVKNDLLYKNGNEEYIFYNTIKNKQFVNPYPYTWNGHRYIVSCLLGGSQWSGGAGLFDIEGNLFKFLEIPRYCTGAIAMPVTIVNQDDSLAVFILQQTTSRSSTLFLLDNKWEIVYKEYLGKGKWFGKISNKDKGFIVVDELPDRKGENAWFYFGK